MSRHQGIRLTYRELWTEVEQAARALLDMGVAKGDRVGMWSPNHVEWMITQYATAKVGAILVCINPAYRTHELRYALNQSGVSVLVAARTFRQTDYVEMIGAVRGDVAPLRHVVLLGQGGTRTGAGAAGDSTTPAAGRWTALAVGRGRARAGASVAIGQARRRRGLS